MAKVKPFKGLRPPREYVTEVASRPYDVLNSAEARDEAPSRFIISSNPRSTSRPKLTNTPPKSTTRP